MKVLDLYCGAGGATYGYMLAGAEVTGVDIDPQPHYIGGTFVQTDVLSLGVDFLKGFDFIHASPPCQAFTAMLSNKPEFRARHVNLIPQTRELLIASGVPYVIENVPSAPLNTTLKLCGTMFDLRVYRHRNFESNVYIPQPQHPKHTVKCARPGCIPRNGEFYTVCGHMGDKAGASGAMGIFWMKTQHEIAESIPPAYTQYIAEHIEVG